MRRASEAYERWVADAIVPVARRFGFIGRGPTFRKPVGENWLLFNLEKHRIDPPEARYVAADPAVEFRANVGIASEATRPKWALPRRPRPPSIHQPTIRDTNRLLEPDPGKFWHVFRADDPDGAAALADRIEAGLGRVLGSLEKRSTDQAIIELRLLVSGPLENLSPGAAEELLALSDRAGDTRLRAEIVAALKRERVPDPELEALRGGWTPPIGQISHPIRPRRQSRRTLEGLLADLRSQRVLRRRVAAHVLGGWDPAPEILGALRPAMDDPDGFTRSTAARSLGHLGDADPATWTRLLALVDDPDADAHEVGVAVVLLARLEPADRGGPAKDALARLAESHPEWSRDLRAFMGRLA